MDSSSILFPNSTIRELSKLISAREISPVELIEAELEQINKIKADATRCEYPFVASKTRLETS